MDIEQLKTLIRDSVHSEVAPLRERATDWGSVINGGRASGPSEAQEAAKKGVNAARIVRAIAAARGDLNRAKLFSEKAYKGEDSRPVLEFFEKANEVQDFDTGGFMVPPDMSDEIIELLRPRSIVRAAGTPVIPMPRGTLTMPKQTGDVSANYVGESEDITKSEPTGGQIILSAKKLAALVPISNDLLLVTAGNKADEFVRSSIVRRVGTREDKAFLRDDGTQNTPKGLRHWVDSDNLVPSNGTTSTNVESDLRDCVQALEGKDVDMTMPVWMMSPRSKNFLWNLRDGNGNLIFPDLRTDRPTLYSFPVLTSNNVPDNLGSGSDESEIYLVNVADCLIAETGGMEITADPGAAYVEGGNLVSAFSRDQTVVRAIVRHDFAVQHNEAIAVMTGVQYGAA